MLSWRRLLKAKMNFVNQPTVKSFQAFSFNRKNEFDKDVWVCSGRAVYNKPTMEDMALSRDMGSAESAVLEETNMYQTDSRDKAADREAEEHEHYVRTHGATLTVSAEGPLFLENEKLEKCRTDAAAGSTMRQVLLQVAPMTPPSVWQTLVRREMRATHFALRVPGRAVQILGDTIGSSRR